MSFSLTSEMRLLLRNVLARQPPLQVFLVFHPKCHFYNDWSNSTRRDDDKCIMETKTESLARSPLHTRLFFPDAGDRVIHWGLWWLNDWKGPVQRVHRSPCRGVISSHIMRECPVPKQNMRPPFSIRSAHNLVAGSISFDWVHRRWCNRSMVWSK